MANYPIPPADDFDAAVSDAINQAVDIANEDRTPGLVVLGDVVEREMQRDEDRAAFERMLHPSARNGLCDLARWQP